MFTKSKLEKAQTELKKARVRLTVIEQRRQELEKSIAEANISARDAKTLPAEYDAVSSMADVEAMSEEMSARSLRAREFAATLEMVRARIEPQLMETMATALNLEHACAALRLDEVNKAFVTAAESLRNALRPALELFSELSKLRCSLNSRLVGRNPGVAHAEATAGLKPNWLKPVHELMYEEIERISAKAEEQPIGLDDDYIFEISHDDRSAAEATCQRGSISPSVLASRIAERRERQAYLVQNIAVQVPDPRDAFSYWSERAESARRTVADARERLEVAEGRDRRVMLGGILKQAEWSLSNAMDIAERWKAKIGAERGESASSAAA